jgi:hypothetical protein
MVICWIKAKFHSLCRRKKRACFMKHLPDFIGDLALIPITAGIAAILFKRLKQPVAPGYIVAGFMAGSAAPWLPAIADMEKVKSWAIAASIPPKKTTLIDRSIHNRDNGKLSGRFHPSCGQGVSEPQHPDPPPSTGRNVPVSADGKVGFLNCLTALLRPEKLGIASLNFCRRQSRLLLLAVWIFLR